MEKLERVLQLCTFAVDSTSLPSTEIARRACSMIKNNCTRAIRTEDLAREIGVHKSHFIRAFTMTTGMAPQTYIRQVRIAQARKLICAGYGLSEVAQMLAFCDQAHFTREFKKVFGVPPGTMSRDIGPERATPGQAAWLPGRPRGYQGRAGAEGSAANRGLRHVLTSKHRLFSDYRLELPPRKLANNEKRGLQHTTR